MEIFENIEHEEENLENDANDGNRGHWENPCDFFVSCLGYAVGLGNIWRFPLLCFKHGGGSFLIPYILMLFGAGLPIFFLEMALGQYAGVGPIKIFGRIAPILQGLGYAVVCVGVLLAFFYNVVVSWSLWYLAVSFSSLLLPGTRLEWEYCDHPYNTKCCRSTVNESSSAMHCEASNMTSSVEEYWDRYVLSHVGHDWTSYGTPRFYSALSLVGAWLIIACCLIKGVKSSGRVSYFTSFLPYIILMILAARSFSLPGAYNGIKEYFLPNWNSLLNLEIWIDAAKQIIFSLGPACGCVITLSSYNHFHRNCQFDAIAIAVANSLTSMFSGCVVFAILGYMAHDSGKSVMTVVKEGPGLAFLVYPEVVTKLPSSSLWATLFFAMLISLALGSIFGAFETVITACGDQWPQLRHYKPQLVIALALLMTVLGLTFTCPGGIHMFTLFNNCAPSWNLIFFALIEVILVAWVYGMDNFLENITEMLGTMDPLSRLYWQTCWKYVTPTILIILMVFEIVNLGHIRYKDYIYPIPIQLLGQAITGISLIWIPIF
eukprot:02458.XXX_40626_42825_1 [CDS] Oithona nana genome sequencing.